MNDFFDKKEFTEQDIFSLIENKVEESINLEFKSSDSIGNQDQKKRELAKDVSSFANSDGGTIIYGIKENNHVAESLSFIEGNIFTKEWIEQVIYSNIHRKIDGILIIPVRFGNNVSKTVYVIKIPESSQAPHMASDKRYYKRYNFESVPMEEYEVRNLYNRMQKTDLSIFKFICQHMGHKGVEDKYVHVDFEINILVKNVGNSIEDRYKLETKIPDVLLYQRDQQIEKFFNMSADKYRIYLISHESPLFQDEEASLCRVLIRISEKTFNNPENFIIRTKLYFSNGIKGNEFDLREILQVNGRKLVREMLRDQR